MRYSAIILLMSALVISITYAQTEEEIPPEPVDGFITEEETPPDSVDVFTTEEEILPDSVDVLTIEEETPTDPLDELATEEETSADPVDGFMQEEEASLPDVDESSEPVTQYSYYEDTSDLIPDNPTAVLEAFFEVLKAGDSESIAFLVSSEALDNIDIMLDILKESLDRDEELTMNRLVAAGYTATVSEIEDWSALEYLEFTISLPIMIARYSMYEMHIGEYTANGNNLDIPLMFVSSAGLELPFEVKLLREDNTWRVSNFMGFNSFP